MARPMKPNEQYFIISTYFTVQLIISGAQLYFFKIYITDTNICWHFIYMSDRYDMSNLRRTL